jgi:two-component SAPR family response regulator
MEFYQQRYQQQQVKWLQKKASELGLVVASPSTPVN